MTNRFNLPLLGVSAALLGYEIAVMRLLALAYGGHFATFTIAIAMLGSAAAALWLHFRRDEILRDPDGVFIASALCFAIAAPACFWLAQQMRFAPYLLAWTPREYGGLALRILLFFCPFFIGGIAVAVPFVSRIAEAGRLYFWILLGSALPAAVLIAAFEIVPPISVLGGISLVASLAVLPLVSTRSRKIAVAGVAALSIVLVRSLPFSFSEYSDLSRTLLLPEARIIEQRYDPDGIWTAVRSPFTRSLPGLSLNWMGRLPRAELLFVDGSASDVVFDAAAARGESGLFAATAEAFSFVIRPRPRVCLLRGGALDGLRSVTLGAAAILAVEERTERWGACDASWRRMGYSPVEDGKLRPIAKSARGFLASSPELFDVIYVSLMEGRSASAAGSGSLGPDSLLTVEGVSAIRRHLRPGGHAIFSAWIENPARTGIRLAGLLTEALIREGVDDPGGRILAFRSWSTVHLLLMRDRITDADLEELRQFAEERSFDVVFGPGVRREETNRFNMIPEDPYAEALFALTGSGADEFRARWPFVLDAPTDYGPFFGHHLRLSAVPELMDRMGSDWIPHVEWGYLIQASALLVAGGIGLVILVWPCVRTGRTRPRVAVLFFLLGAAFMFVEIYAMTRLEFLGILPARAAAFVLTVMLLVSGPGALLLATGERRIMKIGGWITLLVVLLVGAQVFFHFFAPLVLGSSVFLRLLIAAIWIGLPASLMSVPFPYALDRAARASEIPWALGINGLGAVLGSLAAPLVAVHAGTNALWIIPAVLYGVAGLLLARTRNDEL